MTNIDYSKEARRSGKTREQELSRAYCDGVLDALSAFASEVVCPVCEGTSSRFLRPNTPGGDVTPCRECAGSGFCLYNGCPDEILSSLKMKLLGANRQDRIENK